MVLVYRRGMTKYVIGKRKMFLATITGRALRGITNCITSSKRVIEQKIHARMPHGVYLTCISVMILVSIH